MKKRDLKKSPSRFAYDGLDRVIHERARLSLLTALVTHAKGLSFTEMKRLCALTDGNLNRHLLVLEDAKLVNLSKNTYSNRPHTACRITALGRKRYVSYLSVLEQVFIDADAAVGRKAGDESAGALGV